MKTSKIILSIAVIIAIIFGLYLIFFPGTAQQSTNLSTSNSSLIGNTISNSKVIYLNASNFTYTPSIITVKKGDHVKIIIDNQDTQHGM